MRVDDSYSSATLLTLYCHACEYYHNPFIRSETGLPLFRAQGAAQAFEDAGVFGGIFSQSVGLDQIPDALRVFEEVRRPRASDVRRRTLDQKAMFALADGPEQEDRDAKFRAGADRKLFKWLWEYDAAESGREAWTRFIKTHENGVTTHNGI